MRYQLIEEIKTILKSQKVAVFVTHSKEEAFVFADKLALMEQGKIVQFGNPVELYQQPHSRFVADFLGSSNYLPCHLQDSDSLKSALGTFRFDAPLLLANGEAIDSNKPLFCLIRPQELYLCTTQVPNATVLERRFLGHTFEYRLQIDGCLLSMYSNQLIEIKQKIAVFYRPDKVNLFY